VVLVGQDISATMATKSKQAQLDVQMQQVLLVGTSLMSTHALSLSLSLSLSFSLSLSLSLSLSHTHILALSLSLLIKAGAA
jgi:hypothetical protein